MDKLMHDRLKVMRYIDEHPVVVLSTLDDYNRPYGAVVYAVSGDHQTKMHLYFITKSDTAKFHNIQARPAVSITNYDEADVSTLQAQGHAEVEHDPRVIDMVMKQLTRTHAHAAEWLPPIAKLRAGPYVLVGITVSYARIGEFKGKPIGSEDIFTETK
jgi:general stress protein 26